MGKGKRVHVGRFKTPEDRDKADKGARKILKECEKAGKSREYVIKRFEEEGYRREKNEAFNGMLQLYYKGKKVHVGCFKTPEDRDKADKGARKILKECEKAGKSQEYVIERFEEEGYRGKWKKTDGEFNGELKLYYKGK